MKKEIIDSNLESDIDDNKEQKKNELIYQKNLNYIKGEIDSINKKYFPTFQNELDSIFKELYLLNKILPRNFSDEIKIYIKDNKPRFLKYFKEYPIDISKKRRKRNELLSYLGFNNLELKKGYNLNDYFKINFLDPPNPIRSIFEPISIFTTNKYKKIFISNPSLLDLDVAINQFIQLFKQEHDNHQIRIENFREDRITLYEALINANNLIIEESRDVTHIKLATKSKESTIIMFVKEKPEIWTKFIPEILSYAEQKVKRSKEKPHEYISREILNNNVSPKSINDMISRYYKNRKKRLTVANKI